MRSSLLTVKIKFYIKIVIQKKYLVIIFQAYPYLIWCVIQLSLNLIKMLLGPTEFNLLRFLLENQGKVYSRDQLLNHVWDNGSYVEPRTVDVHVRRLRKALNTGFKVDPIRTIRSAGYSLGN